MEQIPSGSYPKFWKELAIANARLSWVVGLFGLLFGLLSIILILIRILKDPFGQDWIFVWNVSAIILLLLMFIPGRILHQKIISDKQTSIDQINIWCYVQIIFCGIALFLFSMVGFSQQGTIIPFAAFMIFVNLFFTFRMKPKLVLNFLAFVMLIFCLSYFGKYSFVEKIFFFAEALGIAVPTFFISHYQYQLKRENFQQRLQLSNQNEAIKTNNSQLMMQALQTQMNPHFIFNTLNTIQHYLVENDQKSSLNSMAKFAGLIRMIFHFSNKQSISLENEIKFLQLYLDLEKLRFEEKVNVQLEIDSSLKQSGEVYSIPPLVIQPIIENAFKHSLMYLESDGHLRVKLYKKTAGSLGVDIENNGPNWGEEPKSTFLEDDKGAGKALELIQERLDVYDKLNPNKGTSSLEILPAVSFPSGSLIRLKLPFALTPFYSRSIL